MYFNPLRYECTTYNKSSHSDNDDHIKKVYNIPKCPYLAPKQFKLNSFSKNDQFTILNVNIRSLGKNLDKLKNCA